MPRMADETERRTRVMSSRERDAELQRRELASSHGYWLDVLLTSTALLVGAAIGYAIYEQIKDVTSVRLTITSPPDAL